jgi:hypothetical protein
VVRLSGWIGDLWCRELGVEKAEGHGLEVNGGVVVGRCRQGWWPARTWLDNTKSTKLIYKIIN